MVDRKTATRQTITSMVQKNSNTVITKSEIERIVGETLDAIIEAAKMYDSVKLKGFGTFKVVQRKPKAYHTPTGQIGCTDKIYRLVFKPSRNVTERLNGDTEESE